MTRFYLLLQISAYQFNFLYSFTLGDRNKVKLYTWKSCCIFIKYTEMKKVFRKIQIQHCFKAKKNFNFNW